MTASFNENPSGSKCQSGSMIQKSSRRAKERRDETNRGGRSREVGSRENIE